MSNRTIVFHHIPKTAGTTFYSILEKEYASAERFRIDGLNPAFSLQKFSSLSAYERDQFKLVYGHLADRFIPLLNTKPIYIVFLREPVDHFISSFFYIQRSRYNRFHNEVKSISIENFIEMRWKERLDNLQTRHIAGETDFILNVDQVPVDSSVHGADLFARAMKRLDHADFILLTEYFDESVNILYDQLQWKFRPYYRIKNKTKKRPASESFSAEILSKIERICSWDMQLYAFAKQHFLERVNLTDKYFQKNIRKFQRINRFVNFFKI